MKTIAGLFAVAVLIVSGTMFYLVKSGVALRTAPLIRPSVIHPEQQNVARSLVARLYPELRTSEFVYWGLPEADSAWNQLRTQVEEHAEKMLGQKPAILDLRKVSDSLEAQASAIRSCPTPCWVILDEAEAHFLSEESRAFRLDLLVQRPSITLTLLKLDRTLEIPDACVAEKRVSRACIASVVTRDSARKFKEPAERYFLLRRYNDRDHFLFVERPEEGL